MKALDGWVLDRAVVLETAHPSSGFIRRLTTAGILRRQAVFARLATTPSSGFRAQALAPDHLLTLHPKALLAEVFGDLPKGLAGALLRLGPFPMQEESYWRLARLLSGDRRRARLLRYVPLSDEKLRVVESLPEALLHVNFASKVMRSRDAEDLAVVMQHIRLACPSASDDAIAASAAETSREPEDWARTWFDKAEVFVKPVQLAAPLFRHVKDAADLQATARRFANCMGWGLMAAKCVAGSNAFYEYTPEEGSPLVVNLQHGGGQWWLTGVYGRSNARVSGEARAFVEGVLSRHGINPLMIDPPAAWCRTLRFLRGRDDDRAFDFDLAA